MRGRSHPTAELLRSFVLGLFVLGVVGVALELVLLEHFEELGQWVPLALFVVALPVLGWWLTRHSRASLRALRLVLIAFVLSGFVGVWLHFDGNVEFELELRPKLGGLELFTRALHGAFPALAPGTMIQLGLLGLAYTFRHPGVAGAANKPSPEQGER